MKSIITEEDLENFSIEWFKEIGYQFIHGPDIAPDSTSPERDDFRKVILEDRLRSALKRNNPGVPSKTFDAAVLKLTNSNIPGLLASNRQFHSWITTGLPISYMHGNQEVGIRLKVIDFENPNSSLNTIFFIKDNKKKYLVIKDKKILQDEFKRIFKD